MFAEGVGRHGNNRDSGCVRVIRGTADRRCLISVHHRYLDVHQDAVIGSGREGEDLNMSTAICPFSAQLTDNPVSYTHLEVYKRQGQFNAMFIPVYQEAHPEKTKVAAGLVSTP